MVVILKIALLGSKGCGKTEITPWSRLSREFGKTVGMDPSIFSTVIPGTTKKVKLQLWELNPGERWDTVRSVFLKGVVGAVIVWDVTDRKSFTEVDKWWERLQETVGDVPVLCVANKTDLLGSREVAIEEGLSYADSRGFAYVECGKNSRADFENALTDLARRAHEWEKAHR